MNRTESFSALCKKALSSLLGIDRGAKMTEHEELLALIKLTNADSQPNLNPLLHKIKSIDALALSVKYFGYELARALAEALPKGVAQPPRHVGLKSKPSTQADIESDWVATWCSALKIPVVFHRKIWELCYVLQALHENGCLAPGSKGIGFGCGQEPMPSYFASRQMQVLVTDINPNDAGSKGWVSSAQHTTEVEKAFKPYLVDRENFIKNCSHRYVDMNNIPADLVGFDFCWSICALEHLGSIDNGLRFIENSLAALKPGGTAVHTTEFNFLNNEETIDNWPTVLFQRRHFEGIALKLTEAGHKVAVLDFDVGSKPLDRFIDTPPWAHDQTDDVSKAWGKNSAHIKLSIDGFVSTCFGIIIQKGC